MSREAHEVASAQILAEYGQPKRKALQWTPPAIIPGSFMATTPYVEPRTTRSGRTSGSRHMSSVGFSTKALSYSQTSCMQPWCWRQAHLVCNDQDTQIPTAGMCMWCYLAATGEGKMDRTPLGLQSRRKGVYKITTHSIPEDLSPTHFSDQVRPEVGGESLSSNYTPHVRRASPPSQP